MLEMPIHQRSWGRGKEHQAIARQIHRCFKREADLTASFETFKKHYPQEQIEETHQA
jgi:hypothetical protein